MATRCCAGSRRTSAPATIPVIMLSADASERNAPRLRAAGASAFLTKPIRVRDLLDAIDAALEP